MLHSNLSSREAREKLLQEIVHTQVEQGKKLTVALQAKYSLQQVTKLYTKIAGKFSEWLTVAKSLMKKIFCKNKIKQKLKVGIKY